MMSRHTHKIRTHDWQNGVLTTFEHFFETLEEAIAFSKALNDQTVKVYNEYDELVHQLNNEAYVPTYA
jgi:hypothetical protein